MYKLFIFDFGEGSFEQGFPVTLQIREDGKSPSAGMSGRLPPAPDIPNCYADWQKVYYSLEMQPRIKFPEAQITNVSLRENCLVASRSLLDRLNQWLCTDAFRLLRESFIEHVKRTDAVRILLQTQDLRLQRLPWHLCNLFERYPRAEVALSAPSYRPSTVPQPKAKVKILAILGSSEGIDTKKDQAVLEQLPNAVPTFLVEPQRQQLNDQLWQQRWDILFFAGHGSSHGETGRIYINATQSLTIEDLKYGLRTAVENGLKLAIFNSCDGLGLARSLADLQIPQTIVMREPVPDLVAQIFLKYFLTTLAQGESLYLSVRRAREQLQGMEDRFPCATWLPVIYQHPAQVPFTWSKSSRQRNLVKALTSGAIAALFTGVVQPTPTASTTGLSPVSTPDPLAERISLGKAILVKAHVNSYKEAGVKAFSSRNFPLAVNHFQDSLKQDRNDPEALIYLNNARIGNNSAFKVAVSVPIGSNLNVAEEILRGVAQAQEEVNRHGGINHKPLQVEIANDENQPDIARELAVRFVKDPDIVAVIGHNASDASVAAAPVYDQNELVMVSPTSFSDKLSSSGKYIFRTAPSIWFVANALSHHAIQSDHKTRIAICSDSLAIDNETFRDNFISAIVSDGGMFVNVPCDFSAPDFNPRKAISDVISSGADSLLLAPHVDRINKAVEVARANQGKLTLYGSPTLYTAQTLQGGQKDVNGLVLGVPWYPKPIPGNSFLSLTAQLWGGSVNWRTALAYDATQAIVTGLQQSTTRKGLQKALRSPDFSAKGAVGTIQFLPSGERKFAPGVGVLVQVEPAKTPLGYTFRPLP